ncbi:MAG TPA: allantoinase AllB, partial [Pseudobdellovibrionaceae bacterium]|nr:allantoinase AllB [Pseudobdellovibrionaceae bacterium]
MSSTMSILKGKRIYIQNGNKHISQARSLLIKDGKISEINDYHYSYAPSLPVYDFQDWVVMPGLVDTHAHINEPGRTEWEGFLTATLAAAAGGITTVVDMPLNSIPATVSQSAMDEKLKSASNKCMIDYGLWGGVIPGNDNELEGMIASGIMGFKCFLCPSGVDEFPHVQKTDLERAMPILARHKIPLLVHAEIEQQHIAESVVYPETDYRSYLASRPPSWELEAISLVIELAEKYQCPTHVVHLSTAKALPMIRAAKERGVPVTVETCPHYLIFDAETVPAGHTEFKCAPPIRDEANRQALWGGVKDGTIDFIVSDHSPCTPALKCLESGNFAKAWGGIAGLQFSLPAVWTEMIKQGLDLSDLIRLMSDRTSQFVGLNDRKGSIAVGKDADFVVWDPQENDAIQANRILHRHKTSPYIGRQIQGRIKQVFLRGNSIFSSGEYIESEFLESEALTSRRNGQWMRRG